MQPSSSLYRDCDALAYNPKSLGERRGAINHVKKAKQRQKGVEIAFDPKAHREFVTGFRKRKQQRRKEAEKQNVKKANQQRLHERAERRTELKQKLGLPDDYGVQDSDSEQDAPAPAAVSEVQQYHQGACTITVSVMDMHAADSDKEPSSPLAVGSQEDEQRTQQQQQQQRTSGKFKSSKQQQPKHQRQPPPKQHKKHKKKK